MTLSIWYRAIPVSICQRDRAFAWLNASENRIGFFSSWSFFDYLLYLRGYFRKLFLFCYEKNILTENLSRCFRRRVNGVRNWPESRQHYLAAQGHSRATPTVVFIVESWVKAGVGEAILFSRGCGFLFKERLRNVQVAKQFRDAIGRSLCSVLGSFSQERRWQNPISVYSRAKDATRPSSPIENKISATLDSFRAIVLHQEYK